jgi:hypothetical protein
LLLQLWQLHSTSASTRMGATLPIQLSLSNPAAIAARISVRTLPVFRRTCELFPNFSSSGAPMQQYVVDHLNELACTRVVMGCVEVLDVASSSKPGQVFEPASNGSLSVSLSESGFYGSRVRGIRTNDHLEYQEVITLTKRRKLLILREMVGAKGFEPSTSWSRTRESKILKPCRCRTYGLSRSQNLPSVGPHGTQTEGLLELCCLESKGTAISPVLTRMTLHSRK